jgi:hypothetical protein
MTRAKRHLALLVPQRFYVTQQSARGDRHVYGALSRFVPAQVAELLEGVHAPRVHPGVAEPAGQGVGRLGVAARGLVARCTQKCERGPVKDPFGPLSRVASLTIADRFGN